MARSLHEILKEARDGQWLQLALVPAGDWQAVWRRHLRGHAWDPKFIQALRGPLDLDAIRALASLPCLSHLALPGLELDAHHAEVIAASLTNLTHLDLSGNDIGDAGASAIAKSLSSLTHLNLTGNDIGDAGASAIAKSLTSLTYLNLAVNRIGAAGAEAIAASLTSLTHLDLSHNGIGDAGAEAIAASLTSLTHLDLSHNGIGDAGAEAIAASLKNLTSLDLIQNNIGDAGASPIAKSLTNLTYLNLAVNGIGDAGASAIAASLTSLTHLNLTGNGIGDAGASAIAASLTSLTHLDLTGNGIGAAGASAIAASLTSLTHLDLGHNSIGDAGASAIAASLTSLTHLHLTGNGIGAAGASAIAASLTSLTHLGLSENNIGAAGASAIAASLTSLTHLGLSENNIGAAGASAIAASLTSLTHLGLAGNGIGDVGATSIAASLTNLTHLDLARNGIGDVGAEALASLILLASLDLPSNPALTTLEWVAPLLPERGGSLKRLYIWGCSGLGLPEATLRETDPATLLAAFRALQTPTSQPLLQTKVVLLGQGRAGKSDLAARLLSGGEQVGSGDTTADFEIHSLPLPLTRDGNPCEVLCRLFDFGGQPELHSTHRFFLQSHRTIYILVLDATQPLAQTRCAYWLRMIRRHGRDAPVIVVCTHADQGLPAFNKAEVEALACEAQVALRDVIVGYANRPASDFPGPGLADRFPAVLNALQGAVADLDYIHTARYPAAFFELLPFVEGRADATRFPDLAAPEPDFKSFSKSTFDRAVDALVRGDPSLVPLRKTCFDELRSLGCFHFVGDHPEVQRNNPQRVGDYCFNPLWVKSPVYRIIRAAPHSTALPTGVVDLSELRRFLHVEHISATASGKLLWGRLPFTDQDIDLLIELLRACELLFDAGDDHVMIPDRLQPEPRPLDALLADEILPPLQYDFLPTGALLRFIGRWAKRIRHNHVHSNEVEVGHESCGEATARVRADVDAREITIVLAGGTLEQRKHLALLIVAALEEIEPSRQGAAEAAAFLLPAPSALLPPAPPDRIAQHLTLGVLAYRAQQRWRAWKYGIYFIFGFATLLLGLLFESTPLRAGLAALGFVILIVDIFAYDPLTRELRSRAAEHFDAAEGGLFGTQDCPVVNPDELDKLAHHPPVTPCAWFTRLNAVPLENQPLLAAAQECRFRVREHALSRLLAWAAALVIFLIPFSIGLLAYSGDWASALLMMVAPLTAWWLLTLVYAAQNGRASSTFRNIERQCLVLANRSGADPGFRKERDRTLRELRDARAAHAPVSSRVYKSLRTTNNKWCDHMADCIEKGQQVTVRDFEFFAPEWRVLLWGGPAPVWPDHTR